MTDSIWAIVAGVSKSLGVTIDYILHEMSFANMSLYSAALPTYRKSNKDSEQTINGDDPANNHVLRDIINQFS